MKYCARDGLRYPDSASHCRSCGAELVYDFEVSDPSQISTYCCPNPVCSELVAQPSNSFCRKCGVPLELISVDLWASKLLEPAFANDPVDVLVWPTSLFARAEEMGLDRREVRSRLDSFITNRAGVKREDVDLWMKELKAFVFDANSDIRERKGRLRKLANDLRIAASFSSHVIDTFLKASMSKQLTKQMGKENDSDPDGGLRTKEFTNRSSNATQRDRNDFIRSSAHQAHDSKSKGTDQAEPQVGFRVGESGHLGSSDAANDAETTHRVTYSGSTSVNSPKRSRLRTYLVASLILFSIGVVYLLVSSKSSETSSQPSPSPVEQKETPTPQPPASPSPQDMTFMSADGFYLGRNDGDEYERPAHWQPVREFYIDKFEVSRADYKKCVDGPWHCALPYEWDHNNYPSGTGDLPVTGVTWDDAALYCKSVGKRLPREYEWEYAARETDDNGTYLYPWGKEWMGSLANIKSDNLQPVNSHQQNSKRDIYNLIGNAWEWTDDFYSDYASNHENRDFRIIRGGSYLSKKPVKSTFRGAMRITSDKSHYKDTGFRCVK